MPRETYVAEELAYLTDVENAKPASYVSYIASSTVSKFFYRLLDMQPSSGADMFPLPRFNNTKPWTEGKVLSGTAANMDEYFGHLKDSPQPFTLMQAQNASGIPHIRAPYDHNASIAIHRFGPVVSCSLNLRFPDTADNKYVEYLVVTSNMPAVSLGTYGSIVLSGSGTNGVSVTCTVSKTISAEYSILDNKYNSDNMYQFLVRNPNGLTKCTVPITLMGVIS
jgi:hypothetical protein